MGIKKNGKYDGIITMFYENGNKKSEGVFKEGKLDGFLSKWYENGTPQTVEFYEDGELIHKNSLLNQ